ncbi:ornithine carbamoyltransferase [Acuticoccus sp. 2012]|uniref:Ornithine carbamoyltransferase n=1 Tax=Acuticoccus mangrovi TaxID=2796142 RepID=A0A934IQI3_9HYPH|nr:ornithine carbamoyltransferase [Acuticoccus mangrovi]
MRHFLDIASNEAATLRTILDKAHRLKAAGRTAVPVLSGNTLAMLFERPSTRTRFSFDLAMREMGGDTIVASGAEMQLGRGESMADTARVLSRYVDAVMIRMLDHDDLLTFAENATVPVINGLTRRSHPCQIIADLMTIEERLGAIGERTVAWVGDGNNVATTFLEAAERLGFKMRLAMPVDFAIPESRIIAARTAGAEVTVTTSPAEAVNGADVVVTDAWVSMGDEDEERRRETFGPYQVDEALMGKAAPEAIFLHCLPAHRGEEVTDAVMDGPRSAVFDEAENRVHAQKAVLAWCFGVI